MIKNMTLRDKFAVIANRDADEHDVVLTSFEKLWKVNNNAVEASQPTVAFDASQGASTM